MFDMILFSAVPYVAIAVMLIGSIWRYFANGYKFSSLSSEFLEGKQLFWGSVPWHYGILVVLFGHLIALLFPREILLWNSVPVRLLILEVTALVFGLLAFVGLVLLIYRRMTHSRIKVVTTKMDVFILALLLLQVITGLAIALNFRWGSSWYAAALAPYLRSVFTFHPNIQYVASLHWLIKVHIVNAFVIVGVIPFTRLVHFLIIPVWYLWRPYQVVMWNAQQRKIRNSKRRV